MQRILVQFDGSNFFNKVKQLSPNTHLTTYNYLNLVSFLTKNTYPQISYYVGEIKQYKNNQKSKRLYANQQSLFSNLRKQGINIKLGYLLKSDGKYHEKGVDVQIAADMIYGAMKDEYDICYLISSDTDLLPAVKIAKNEHKHVVYVGFEYVMSRALMNNCSSYKVLTKDDVLSFEL